MRSYNNFSMKGRLYTYELREVDTDKGTAISGNVTLEVDEKGTQAKMDVFAYPKYNSGKTNRTYGILEDMMAGNYQTVQEDGGDAAAWFGITGNVSVNYYVGRQGANTPDELGRAQKLRASFINANREHAYQNEWKVDMLIYAVQEREADEEKGWKHCVDVWGYLPDTYRERVNQFRARVYNEMAMQVIMGLPATPEQPYFTSVRGKYDQVKNITVVKGMFGEDDVKEYLNTEWVLNWLAAEPYDFGDERAMTVEDYKKYRDNLEKYKVQVFEDDKGSGEDEDDNSAGNGLAF